MYFVAKDGTKTPADTRNGLTLPDGCVILGWSGQTGLFRGWLVTSEPDPPPVPSVTPWQARKALNATGLREPVEAWIATQTQEVRDGWEYATEVRRDHPMIAAAIAQEVLTDGQVDQLFALAAGL